MEPLKPGTLLIGHSGKTIAMILSSRKNLRGYQNENGRAYKIISIMGVELGSFTTGFICDIFIHFRGSGWNVIEGKR